MPDWKSLTDANASFMGKLYTTRGANSNADLSAVERYLHNNPQAALHEMEKALSMRPATIVSLMAGAYNRDISRKVPIILINEYERRLTLQDYQLGDSKSPDYDKIAKSLGYGTRKSLNNAMQG